MNNDLKNAKALFDEKGYSCVLYHGETVYTSRKTGISPMLDFLSSGVDLQGFCVADKIVGKATALLFAFARVEAVYGRVMSKRAVEVFEDTGIHYYYDILTDEIMNRKGTGSCPMEEAVVAIEKPSEAFLLLTEKMKQMRGD